MSGAPTYPRLDKSAPRLPVIVRPRPHPLPCYRPPSEPIPHLPARPPRQPAPAGYVRTSHVVPAAYPRSSAACYGSLSRESRPYEDLPLAPGGDRQAHASKRSERAGQAMMNAKHWSAEEIDKQAWKGLPGQWLAAERWARRGSTGGGVTLVCCHANGCTKEGWEPALRRLLDKGLFDPTSPFGDLPSGPTSEPRLQVDEIWMLDDTMQNASIDLNQGRLGAVRLWRDAARDVINLIENCLSAPTDEHSESLQWHEPRPSERTVIGVGHSIGGSAILQAAASRPDLFHSILMVDPACSPLMDGNNTLASSSFKRRDTWPSRSAAMESLLVSPFYRSWHPDQRPLLNDFGIVPSQGDAVQLATPSWSEGVFFSAPGMLMEHWNMFPSLLMPVGFLMQDDPSGKMQTIMFGGRIGPEMVWRPPRARNEIVPGAGHLIPQEKPDELAEAMWRFLGAVTSGRWDEWRPAVAKL